MRFPCRKTFDINSLQTNGNCLCVFGCCQAAILVLGGGFRATRASLHQGAQWRQGLDRHSQNLSADPLEN